MILPNLLQMFKFELKLWSNYRAVRPFINTIITKTGLCNILQFFTAVKNNNFHMKKCDIFLIFAQNIDCGYTLEPPQ